MDETLSRYSVVCDEKYREDVVGIWDAFERWMNPSSRSSSDRGSVWGRGFGGDVGVIL